MKKENRLFITLLSFIFLINLAFFAEGKEANSYVNLEDQDLFIKKVLLLSPKDNIGGVYSTPLAEHLKSLIEEDRQWDLAFPSEASLKIFKKDHNLEDPSLVAQSLSQEKADGLLIFEISKGPNGISMTLSLYTARKGQILVRESLNNFNGFEISVLKSKLSELFNQLKNRLPFKGYILSRNGLNITLNLGKSFNLKPGSKIDIIQILKIHRHPKLGFMVGAEKEIIGKGQVYKVDRSISFAVITFEKEPGIIDVGAKTFPEGFVYYPTPLISPETGIIPQNELTTQNNLVFGQNPTEWLPKEDPQYGSVGFLGGLGQYRQDVDLEAENSYKADNRFIPALKLKTELWLNSEWHVGFQTRQSVFSVKNPLPESSPNTLNVSLSQYDLYVLYNFLLHGDFWGPKFQIALGQHIAHFDASSGTPTALTKMNYGGTYIRFSSAFDVSNRNYFEVGAHYKYFITKSLTENPTSGLSSSSNMNMFGFFGHLKTHKYFRWVGELDFESYSTDFSGTGTRTNPASKINHQNMFALGGFEFLF